MTNPTCRFCGTEFPVERLTEAGFDYCIQEACRKKGAKPLALVGAGVNKATAVVMTRDQAIKEGLLIISPFGERHKLAADQMPNPRKNGYPTG